MPKRPILSRDTYFVQIAGSGAPGYPLLKRGDWNTVQVEGVGMCVEPCQDPGPDATGPALQIDLTDAAWNAVHVLPDELTFQTDFGTGGRIVTYDYNT